MILERSHTPTYGIMQRGLAFTAQTKVDFINYSLRSYVSIKNPWYNIFFNQMLTSVIVHFF